MLFVCGNKGTMIFVMIVNYLLDIVHNGTTMGQSQLNEVLVGVKKRRRNLNGTCSFEIRSTNVFSQ
jgi:hypothetical protein